MAADHHTMAKFEEFRLNHRSQIVEEEESDLKRKKKKRKTRV